MRAVPVLLILLLGCSENPKPTTPVAPGVTQKEPSKEFDIIDVVLPDDYTTYNHPEDVPQEIEFNQTTWKYVGQAKHVSGRFQMIPIMYTAGDRDKRLVIEYASTEEQVYDQMTYEQQRINGRWVDHGLRENILLDGTKDKYSMVNGEHHGTSRIWWPNGQLRREETYSNGKLQGHSRGWYKNGNREYESFYHQNKEVAGKAWKEDGTERP